MQVEDVTDLDWYIDNVLVPAGPDRTRVGPVLARRASWSALARQLEEGADASSVGAATRLAVAQGFVITRAQARGCGVPEVTVRRLVRRGDWTPCGRGSVAVVPATGADSSDAARRAHALRASAAGLRRSQHVVATASAAIMHGLPTFRLPPMPELVAGPATTSGRLAAAHVRVPALRRDDVESWFGVPVTTVARTVVDLARFDHRSGLMAADAALHEGLLSPAELAREVERAAGRWGVRRAREVLDLASPLIESPLESVTHLALYDDGFPAPRLQRWLRGADGKWYRVDFLWPERRLVLEADGRGKYRDDALWDEKAREIALARAGWRIARVRWTDVVDDWPATSAWLRALVTADPSY